MPTWSLFAFYRFGTHRILEAVSLRHSYLRHQKQLWSPAYTVDSPCVMRWIKHSRQNRLLIVATAPWVGLLLIPLFPGLSAKEDLDQPWSGLGGLAKCLRSPYLQNFSLVGGFPGCTWPMGWIWSLVHPFLFLFRCPVFPWALSLQYRVLDCGFC